jgi:NAD(P)-dependent dehydrogenase (short-subunit alcohol dehydrogenase family)
MRLEGKIAIVTGAGQRAGEGVGNGRATAMRFAREGANVILANRSGGSVEETRDLIRAEISRPTALLQTLPMRPIAPNWFVFRTQNTAASTSFTTALASFGRMVTPQKLLGTTGMTL